MPVPNYKQYESEVQERFGKTDAYKESQIKTAGYSGEKWTSVVEGMEEIFEEFAACKSRGEVANGHMAQSLAKKLQNHITDNFYTCTHDILAGLGEMYLSDDRFRQNLDKHGSGTADYVAAAIRAYTAK